MSYFFYCIYLFKILIFAYYFALLNASVTVMFIMVLVLNVLSKLNYNTI